MKSLKLALLGVSAFLIVALPATASADDSFLKEDEILVIRVETINGGETGMRQDGYQSKLKIIAHGKDSILGSSTPAVVPNLVPLPISSGEIRITLEALIQNQESSIVLTLAKAIDREGKDPLVLTIGFGSTENGGVLNLHSPAFWEKARKEGIAFKIGQNIQLPNSSQETAYASGRIYVIKKPSEITDPITPLVNGALTVQCPHCNSQITEEQLKKLVEEMAVKKAQQNELNNMTVR